MTLFVGQMLKVSRRCSRETLVEPWQALTPYAATPVVVVGRGRKRWVAAFVKLAELVQHRFVLAQQAGVLLVPLGWLWIPVVWTCGRCGEC